MTSITAATITDVDVEQIAKVNPKVAAQIIALGGRVNAGIETDDEFAELCRLLNENGNREKARQLRLANCGIEEGADFDSTFPECKTEFDSAVQQFQSQFNCTLTADNGLRHLSTIFHARSTMVPEYKTQGRITQLISGESGADILITHRADMITADVSGRVDPYNAVRLQFRSGTWELVPS